MPGIGNLSKGAMAGRETKLYYDSVVGSYSDPPTEDAVWVEITRGRNVQFNRPRTLPSVEMHGVEDSGSIPGYRSKSGSFEYVRRRGVDTVYNYLKAQADAGNPIFLRLMDGDIATSGMTGSEGPFYLGDFNEVRNGSDPVVVNITFSHADVVDHNGDRVEHADVVIA